MSDLSRVQSETLSDKLYSTRRGTDFIKGPENRGKKRSLLPHATRAAANYQFSVLRKFVFHFYDMMIISFILWPRSLTPAKTHVKLQKKVLEFQETYRNSITVSKNPIFFDNKISKEKL